MSSSQVPQEASPSPTFISNPPVTSESSSTPSESRKRRKTAQSSKESSRTRPFLAQDISSEDEVADPSFEASGDESTSDEGHFSETEVTNQELASILLNRMAMEGQGKSKSSRSKRPSALAASSNITFELTGKRKRGVEVPASKEPLAIPAPISHSASLSENTLELPGKATTNPIRYFYTEVDSNPRRISPDPTDRYYQCNHTQPSKEARVFTITQKMNGNSNSLVKHLKDFPLVFELYLLLKDQESAPTMIQLQAAKGEQTPEVLQYLQELQTKSQKQKNAGDKFSEGFHQEKLEELIVKWQTMRNQPFDEVESSHFKEMLEYAHQGPVTLPTGFTMKRRMMDLSQKGVEETKQMIKNLKAMVSLSLDAWSSSNGYAFLAIVMHYITNDWELEELLIDFQELKGEHSGKNMCDSVWKTMKFYDLIGRVKALTLDNASNNDTLVENLEKLCKELGIDFSAEVARMRCLPHTIHLAALQLLESIGLSSKSSSGTYQDDVQIPLTLAHNNILASSEEADTNLQDELGPLLSVAFAIEKLRKIVRTVHSSPQRRAKWLELIKTLPEEIEAELNETLQIIAEVASLAHPDEEQSTDERKLQEEHAKMLILDVKTRWSSTHQMIERALLYRWQIDLFVVRLNDSGVPSLSENEWTALVIVERWLRIFRVATTQMSSTSSVTISSVHGIFKALQSHLLEELTKLPNNCAPELRDGLLKSFEKLSTYYYKSDASPYYIWAAILDPRINYQGLKLDNKGDFVGEKHIKHCKTLLEEHFHKSYVPAIPPVPPAPATSSLSSSSQQGPRAFIPRKSNFDFLSRFKPQVMQTPIADELQVYLNSWISEPERLAGPLAWWKQNQERFPNLSCLARDILAIPCSAVAVERIFSGGRDTISLRRSSLKPETIRSLMLLRQRILSTDGRA